MGIGSSVTSHNSVSIVIVQGPRESCARIVQRLIRTRCGFMEAQGIPWTQQQIKSERLMKLIRLDITQK